MEKMRATVFHGVNDINDIRVEEVERPRAGVHEEQAGYEGQERERTDDNAAVAAELSSICVVAHGQ
jgi:hypothetical protein